MSGWCIIVFLLFIEIFVIYVEISGGDLRRIGRRQKGFTQNINDCNQQSNAQFLNIDFSLFAAKNCIFRIVFYFKVTQFYIKNHCAAMQRKMQAF